MSLNGIIDGDEKLNEVFYLRDHEMSNSVVEVVLVLDRSQITISATDEDSILVEVSNKYGNYEELVIVSSGVLWEKAIGLPLMWSWELTNNQGYKDGVQFEFSNSVEEPNHRIQLMAYGCALRIYGITEMSTN